MPFSVALDAAFRGLSSESDSHVPPLLSAICLQPPNDANVDRISGWTRSHQRSEGPPALEDHIDGAEPPQGTLYPLNQQDSVDSVPSSVYQ